MVCRIFLKDCNELKDRIIEYSEEQTNTMLTLIVNLDWSLVREMINHWTSMDSNDSEWAKDKIKQAQKLTDNFQELESIVKGVPIG